MKYPFIGEAKLTGAKVLFFTAGCGAVLDGETYEIGNYNERFSMPAFIDITKEYLQNTYGEVVSAEHAEFIIELCESNGLSVHHDEFHVEKNFFALNGSGKLFFFPYETQSSINKRKQITIPLPPKADSKKWTPDFYDLGELPKHFDCVCNKCGGKCCAGQCEDFPKVGDEILTASKSKAKVLAKHEGKLWIEYINGGKGLNTINAATIQKPKTPEEELRDHIVHLIDDSKRIGANSCALAMHLMSELDIKKKPQ